MIASFTPHVEGHLKSNNENALVQLPCTLSQRVLALLLHRTTGASDPYSNFRLKNTLQAARHQQAWKDVAASPTDSKRKDRANLVQTSFLGIPFWRVVEIISSCCCEGGHFCYAYSCAQLQARHTTSTNWPLSRPEAAETRKLHNQRTVMHLWLLTCGFWALSDLGYAMRAQLQTCSNTYFRSAGSIPRGSVRTYRDSTFVPNKDAATLHAKCVEAAFSTLSKATVLVVWSERQRS